LSKPDISDYGALRDKPHNTVILAVLALIIGAYALMAFRYPVAYIWATYEDLVGEWAQTWSFLAATVLAVAVAARKTRYRWFFALLAVACSYVFLEEISWGQRIFGFDTPEFLKSRNLQGEANVHNLFTGPHKTLLKDLISIAVSLALVGYGLVYPLLQKLEWRVALWFDRIGVAAPPLILWPFFTIAAFFELKPLSFNEAEVAELLIAFALATTALYYLFATRHELTPGGKDWDRNHSLVFGQQVVVLAVAILGIASVTTVAFYSVPANKLRVDNRIENGIEKFAGRYERYDRCDIAVDLYQLLLQKEPERVYILRKSAACYREMSQAALYEETIAKAISIDRERYAEEPWRASVNQSLIRSYRLAGNDELAEAHLDEALRIGMTRVTKHPDSASAAYSYGRTLQLAGHLEEAFEQFTRAYDIDRSSSRYRRAYFAARAALAS
jgi:tetratricopeptide (TPR) repeat protein